MEGAGGWWLQGQFCRRVPYKAETQTAGYTARLAHDGCRQLASKGYGDRIDVLYAPGKEVWAQLIRSTSVCAIPPSIMPLYWTTALS